MFQTPKKLITHSFTFLHRRPAILNKPGKRDEAITMKLRVYLVLRDGCRGPEPQELSSVGNAVMTANPNHHTLTLPKTSAVAFSFLKLYLLPKG